jgi:RNA polymerase sigma-70 factor (ECF subfamily)
MVYGICRRVLRDAVEAEDITQECFEHLAQTKSGPNRHLGGWLHAVAAHRSLNRIKEKNRRRERETKFAASQQTSTQIEWNDIYDFVDEAIVALPEELRMPLIAHFLQGESHTSIAKLMGIPRQTVSYRISEGIKLVGSLLQKRGIIAPAAVLSTLLSANLASAAPLPVSLAASLGKLGLVHSAKATAAVPISYIGALSVLKGVLTMKTVSIFVVVTFVSGPWLLGQFSDDATGDFRTRKDRPESTTPAETELIVSAQATVEEDADSDEWPIPNAQEIIAAFQATLASQLQSGFIFKYSDTTHGSIHPTPIGRKIRKEGDMTYYRAGEFAIDGHRVAYSENKWGQLRVNSSPNPKSDPWFSSTQYDGNVLWNYQLDSRRSGTSYTSGRVSIIKGRTSKHFNNGVGLTSPTHWLQGYISKRGDRVDTLMRNAQTLTIRKVREKVGDSMCDVVDFVSPYASGTLWFDPARGHLLAQAEIHLPPGHFYPNGERSIAGASSHCSLRDVSFQKVEGIWFATSAAAVGEIQDPEFSSIETSQPRITNIVVNPDMDALEIFSTDAIKDGATVAFSRETIRHRWRNGKIVPDNSLLKM